MIDKKAVSTKKGLLTAIRGIWNHIALEYCFKLVNSIPERNKVIIKARSEIFKLLFWFFDQCIS